VTACTLFAALQRAGATGSLAVYDGSWTEYAGQPKSPIARVAEANE
jgi:3-mercaptopyruvate sulfurtransferase SseA